MGYPRFPCARVGKSRTRPFSLSFFFFAGRLWVCLPSNCSLLLCWRSRPCAVSRWPPDSLGERGGDVAMRPRPATGSRARRQRELGARTRPSSFVGPRSGFASCVSLNSPQSRRQLESWEGGVGGSLAGHDAWLVGRSVLFVGFLCVLVLVLVQGVVCRPVRFAKIEATTTERGGTLGSDTGEKPRCTEVLAGYNTPMAGKRPGGRTGRNGLAG
jgi:hypothetical protein